MNRREFVQLLTAATVMRTMDVTAATNPKVIFFGMCVVEGVENSPVRITIPAAHGHAPFMLTSDRILRALGGSPVATDTAGLAQAHPDLAKPSNAWCMSAVDLVIGNGNATVASSLLNRLPSISAMANMAAPAQSGVASFKFDRKSLPRASCSATLGGGELRNAGVPSQCAGTHAKVAWNFFAGPGKKQIGGPHQLTDIAVFHSLTPTLEISAPGGKYTLQQDDVVWIINFPMFHGADNTPFLIENAHDWLSLVTPAFPQVAVTAETTNTFARLKSSNREFVHPCASTPAARKKAKAEYLQHLETIGVATAHLQQMAVAGSQYTILYIPPDTDPCFMVRS